MKICVLSRGPTLYSTSRIAHAGRRRQHDVRIVDPYNCLIGCLEFGLALAHPIVELASFDVVIPRVGASSMPFGLPVVEQFEMLGTPAVNSADAFELARNKILASQVLTAASLPVPRTLALRNPQHIDRAIELLGGPPVVVKLHPGTQGVGVAICETVRSIRSTVEAFWSLNREVLLQEFIAEASGTDVRMFVVDGEVYFIPADNGATAIAYNTEEVPAEDVSTLQVFVDPKYAGRTSLPDNVDDAYALAYLATGVTDWTTATQEEFEAAAAWLRLAHENARTYWTDGAEAQQLFASGEVLVMWAWGEIPTTLRAEDFPIGFNREPAEGSSYWSCGYVNLVDGPGSEEKAHQFVEAWLQPSTADYIVREWGYGHSNEEAMAAQDAELLEEVGLGPVEVPLLFQLPLDNTIREQMIAEFEKIKAGF